MNSPIVALFLLCYDLATTLVLGAALALSEVHR
jgi:hypothetical protein